MATSCGERRSSPRWNAGLPGVPLLSGALRVLVIAIGVVVMALEQLGLATSIILTVFAITFGALMPGLAIACGLGSQAAAKTLIPREKKRDTDAGSWELGVGS